MDKNYLSQEKEDISLPAVYGKYFKDLFRYSFSILKNSEDAKDAVQEVFVKYATNSNSFKGDCSIKTWLLVLTRNYCFNFLNKKGNNIEGIEDDAHYTHAVYPSYDDHISLNNAIENLPPGLSELIFLKDYEGYSYKEIADITNQTIENVKIKLFRGRQQLKKFFNDGV